MPVWGLLILDTVLMQWRTWFAASTALILRMAHQSPIIQSALCSFVGNLFFSFFHDLPVVPAAKS
jgi:hypothetical protein